MDFQNEKGIHTVQEKQPLCKRSRADVELVFPNENASIVAQSLAPEIENLPTNRININLRPVEGNILRFTILADDSSALRAALNSYLRWIGAITRGLEAVDRCKSLGLASLLREKNTKP